MAWFLTRPSLKHPNPHCTENIYSFFNIFIVGWKRNILYNCILFEFTELEHLSATPVFKALFMSTAFYLLFILSHRNSKTDLSLLSDLYSPLSLYTEKLPLCFPRFQRGFFSPWNPTNLGAVLSPVNHLFAIRFSKSVLPLSILFWFILPSVSMLFNLKPAFSKRTSHGYGDP